MSDFGKFTEDISMTRNIRTKVMDFPVVICGHEAWRKKPQSINLNYRCGEGY